MTVAPVEVGADDGFHVDAEEEGFSNLLSKSTKKILKHQEDSESLSRTVEEQQEVRTRAENGQAGSQYALGKMLELGHLCKPDPNEAVHWYEQASHHGHPSAQYALGHCFERGLGVSQDVTAAIEWYEKAAHLKVPAAQFRLGAHTHANTHVNTHVYTHVQTNIYTCVTRVSCLHTCLHRCLL